MILLGWDFLFLVGFSTAALVAAVAVLGGLLRPTADDQPVRRRDG